MGFLVKVYMGISTYTFKRICQFFAAMLPK